MNARRLGFVMMVIIAVCLALSSRSTLLPERGADHVFYGAEDNNFLDEEMAIGNFNGDIYDDIVTTALWSNQECGGWRREDYTSTQACDRGWSYFLATNGATTVRVCKFADPSDQADHWERWTCLGYDSVHVPSAPCDSCWTRERGLQGLAYIFHGGDWSGKSHDIDLSVGGADVVILGRAPGGRIYNAMAAGDMDGDGKDELALGAPGAGPAGEVYVIRGSSAWPDTIDLHDPGDFDDWVLYFISGRDEGDDFGMGIAMGDLNNDDVQNPLSELVVVAPSAGGDKGEVYVFYGDAEIPSEVPLDTLDNTEIAGYAQVILGGTPGDHLGVTPISEMHPPHHGFAAHPGGYEPVGVGIGNWNTDIVDDRNDLVLGAGSAASYDGKAFVIFGGGVSPKLAPGNSIYLSSDPGAGLGRCDLRIEGDGEMAFGAAVEFADADADGDQDLLLGAPLATIGGDNERGEVFIIFGDTKSNLSGTRSVTNASDTDVKIYGKDRWDQFGAHFTGNLDIDHDGKFDIGIAGKSEMTVIFGQGQSAWPGVLDLGNAINTNPTVRILDFQPQQYASSTTIRLANLDGDDFKDLVFGGYDSPGYSPGDPTGESGIRHAGQMWVTKGSDLWKSGAVSSTQTWSGNVFVDGDLAVTSGGTLTIAAGTDVWVWPRDVKKNGLGADTTSVEIRVENGGSLIVQGAAGEDSVRFVAYDPDTSFTNANDKWFGIWVDDGGTATIDHAIIRNALRGVQARSSMTLKNSIIEDCKIVGITIAGDSTNADSVYVENTTFRRIGPTSGGIGVNALGKKAAILLKNCDVENCDIGIACYTKAKLYTDGTDVRNMATNGIRLNNRSTATLYNSTVELNDLAALRVYNAAWVTATACTFRTSDYGADVTNQGGSPALADFTSCTFTSNDVGLRVVSGAEATLTACQIYGNPYEGVYCIGGSVSVAGTAIGVSNNGVMLDGASGDFNDAVVTTEGGNGIYVDNGSYVGLLHSRVWDNFNGIVFEGGSVANLDNCNGTCPSQSCTNGNSFKDNGKHIVNQNSSGTIDAECNYWGGTPTSGMFAGSVDYTPYLTSDPTEDLMTFELPSSLPSVFALKQNYPNPFNPVTTIGYDVPSPGGDVQIRIYNVNGQLVRTLVNGFQPAGQHQTTWKGLSERGSPVASGVYFMDMRAPNFHSTKKLVLLK